MTVGTCLDIGDETATVHSRGEQCSGGYQLTDGTESAKVLGAKWLTYLS